MDKLKELSKKRLNELNFEFKRYLYNQVSWDSRFIAILGARGVGKTTMLLQRMKEISSEDAIYVSLDTFYFVENKLVDFVEEFTRRGGRFLFLDEVHKYQNWSQELKNIYDFFPELKIVLTSSSALEIYKGQYDLSRRLLTYNLQGLSFREYLILKHKIEVPLLKLDQILEDENLNTEEILRQIRPYKYLSDYLQKGYYPFALEDEQNYHSKLLNAINIVLESDLPATNHIDYYAVMKLKKLLYILSRIVPYIPNVSELARQAGTTRDTVLKYLSLLHQAHIVRWLTSDAYGINFLNKPDKIYLENTNIAAALNYESQAMNEGNLRETFLLNQLSAFHDVRYPVKGDFLVDDKWILEAGGKSKTQKQIYNLDNAYIVADDMEYRVGRKIPLWLFGLIY
ncbi:MAG: AAA family ATPase [Bacteroidales bacterium]